MNKPERPELFTRAHTAFTGLLKNEGIEYA